MTDLSKLSVRGSLLHLLSVPKDYIIQQLSLTELEAVANSLEEIAAFARSRLDASLSPLKSSNNQLIGFKREQMEACQSKLRRYFALSDFQTAENIDGVITTSTQADFKLLHQNINHMDPSLSYTLLIFEFMEEYGEGTLKKFISTKISISGEWICLWTLNSTVMDRSNPQFYINMEESGINDKALAELYQQASPDNFTENVFLLALSVLMVDLVQKAQGIQITSTPFEEIMAHLIDKTLGLGRLGPIEFELDEPAFRKRSSQVMDADVVEFQTDAKRLAKR